MDRLSKMERVKQAIYRPRKTTDAAPTKTNGISLKAMVVGDEQERMDKKLGSSMEKVTYCHMAGQTADENLLLEVESMLDDLKMEIIVLRETNSELWAQIAERDSATSPSRQRIEFLTKANAQLEHEVSVLCEQLKNFEIYRMEELADIQSNHYRVINEREMLVEAMKMAMEEKDRYCREEKKILNEKIAQLEESRRADKFRLKEDLKRTQESHHKYLSKLNYSLKKAQLARKVEMARQSEELDIVKHEKQALLRKLRRLARQGDVPCGVLRKKEQDTTLRNPRMDDMFDLLWDSKETEEVKRSVKRQREERSTHPWAPNQGRKLLGEKGVRRALFFLSS